MKTIRLFLLLPLLFGATISVGAEISDSLKFNKENFYVGAHAAITTAESNFSSFGANAFRPGWNAGLNVGYRFSPTWSVELVASWNRLSLSAQDCCLKRNYFLGSDFNRYHPNLIPADMQGLYYDNILSKTFVQRYGLLINFNLLSLFNHSYQTPWRLDLAPAAYIANTNSHLLDKTNKASFKKGIIGWHLGYGGQVFASYTFAENMHVGIYGGYTQYLEQQIDGLPRVHSTNYTFDVGAKIIYTFNKKGKEAISASELITVIPDISSFIPNDSITELESSFEEIDSLSGSTEITDTIAVEAQTPSMQHCKEEKEEHQFFSDSPFPIIYFSFNSIWIEPGQRSKVVEIAQALKADSSIRIRIVGWGDEVGGEDVNKRVSLKRAEAVKKRLVKSLISADRIEVIGAGIAHNAPSPEEGRVAIIRIIP